jgi:putative SOS response-associated peptidase YedK
MDMISRHCTNNGGITRDHTAAAICYHRGMCGRFTQHYTWREVHAFLSVFGTPRNLQPHYNIAPTTMIDVVRTGVPGRELVPMRWGLIPGWWKKSVREMAVSFNARAETVAERPMFRDAFKRRRCIIPASGFYEWTGGKKDRQPHLFSAADGAPVLALAGLWDKWRDPTTGSELMSATIIVSSSNTWMSTYHDRMPVLLAAEHFDGWLNGSVGLEILNPAPETALREWPVSKRMNATGAYDDDPTVLNPERPAGGL